jgi:hypothetical protein
LDGLEATGFVARTMHPGDRRATLLTLTGHGTAVAKAMQADEQRLARFLSPTCRAGRWVSSPACSTMWSRGFAIRALRACVALR